MNKHLKLLIFALSMLIVSSCQSQYYLTKSTSQNKLEESTNNVTVTLNFWHTYSEQEAAVFENKVLPLFHQTYPHIRIVSKKEVYSEQLKDTVIAAALEKNSPDFMRLDMIWVPELARLSLLEPLTQFHTFSNVKERVIPALLETNLYNGQYFGLPVNANTKTAIFNRQLLKEAGYLNPPATFEELNDIRQSLLVNHSHLSSIGICCTSSWGTLSYFWTLGGELTNPSYSQATGYLDSEASIDALTKFKVWYDEGIVGETILTGEPGTWDGLIQNQFIMIDEAHWFYTVRTPEEQALLNEQTIIAPFPSDVRNGVSIIGGENLVIFSSTKHPEEAWLFLEWMMTEVPQALMSNTGLLSPLLSNHSTNETTITLNHHSWYKNYRSQLTNGKPRPVVDRWSDIDDEYSRMIERILYGELSVEEAVKQSAKKIDGILKGH